MLTVQHRSAEKLVEYFEIMAMIHRPVESPVLDGEFESKMIQLSTLNDGKPQRPKIEAMITDCFGKDGWKLWHWWMPEPDEF
jgi:hypothetical protein